VQQCNVTALEKDPSKARLVSKQASSPGVLRSLTSDRGGRLRGDCYSGSIVCC